MTNINAATNRLYLNSIDRDYAATLHRQSWSQTRAIDRRVQDAAPIYTEGDNGDSEPWDWIHGEYTAVYLLPKYGYIVYHRTGAGGSEAAEAEGGCYVGGSALYAVNPWSINALIDPATRSYWEDVSEFLRYNAIELTHSRD